MNWVRLAATSEVEVGQIKGFVIGHKKIALYHTVDGFYATSDLCSHSGRLLSAGSLNQHTVMCPAHGGKFNVKSGQATAFPCVEPVKPYPLDIRGHEVWIKLY